MLKKETMGEQTLHNTEDGKKIKCKACGVMKEEHMHFVEFTDRDNQVAALQIINGKSKFEKLVELIKGERKCPKLLISVVGGTSNIFMPAHGKEKFYTGLKNIANMTDAWIVTGGTNKSVMTQVSEAIMESKKDNNDIPVIGVAPWSKIQFRDDMVNHFESKEETFKYRLNDEQQEGKEFLDSNHSHYLCVEDKMRHRDCRWEFEKKLLEYISRNHDKKDDNPTGKRWPIKHPAVLMVIQGGPNALLSIKRAIENGIPVVLIKGFLGVTDILIKALQGTRKINDVYSYPSDAMAEFKHLVKLKTEKHSAKKQPESNKPNEKSSPAAKVPISTKKQHVDKVNTARPYKVSENPQGKPVNRITSTPKKTDENQSFQKSSKDFENMDSTETNKEPAKRDENQDLTQKGDTKSIPSRASVTQIHVEGLDGTEKNDKPAETKTPTEKKDLTQNGGTKSITSHVTGTQGKPLSNRSGQSHSKGPHSKNPGNSKKEHLEEEDYVKMFKDIIQKYKDETGHVYVCDLVSTKSSVGFDMSIYRILTGEKMNDTKRSVIEKKLYLAIQWNDINIAKEILENNQVNKDEIDLDRIILEAVKNEFVDLVKLLFDHGFRLKKRLGAKDFQDLYDPKSFKFKGLLDEPARKKKFSKELHKMGYAIPYMEIEKDQEKPSRLKTWCACCFNDKRAVKNEEEVKNNDTKVDVEADMEPKPRPHANGVVRSKPANNSKRKMNGIDHNKHRYSVNTLRADEKDTQKSKNADAKPVDDKPPPEKREKKYGDHDLFIWCLLIYCQEMATIFWSVLDEPIAAALFVRKLYNTVTVVKHEHDPEVLKKIQDNIEQFETLAIGVLESCYMEGTSSDVLRRKLEHWENRSSLVMAAQSDNKRFMSHLACQEVLNKIWEGEIPKKNSDSKEGILEKLKRLMYIPKVAYILHVLSYIFFLGLYSYLMLVRFAPVFTYQEGIIIFWIFTIVLEEIRQVYDSVPRPGMSKMYNYFQETWNVVDFIAIVTFCIGIVFRCIPNDVCFEIARTILCITLIVFYVRILQIFVLSKWLGPKLVMIYRMVWKDLAPFMVILGVFIFAYAVTSESLLYPNTEFSISMFYYVPRKAYWQIYGELFLEDIEGTSPCTNDPALYGNYAETRCPSQTGRYLTPVLLGMYIMISNVLLLNILVAMFGYTHELIQQNTYSYWCIQHYQLVYEYCNRPFLPPPLIIILHLKRVITYLRGPEGRKKFGCKKNGDKDGDVRKNDDEDMTLSNVMIVDLIGDEKRKSINAEKSKTFDSLKRLTRDPKGVMYERSNQDPSDLENETKLNSTEIFVQRLLKLEDKFDHQFSVMQYQVMKMTSGMQSIRALMRAKQRRKQNLAKTTKKCECICNSCVSAVRYDQALQIKVRPNKR